MLWLMACTPAPVEPGPEFTLAFAGDVTLGRRLNVALAPGGPGTTLSNIEPLVQADLTVVNAEGVISRGGRYYDKGESRPHMYRARPEAMDLMKGGSVDIVAVGNNHANDYGPQALTEMLDRIVDAGMDYTGAGVDIEDAKRPAYAEMNGLTVAFVGGDLTYSAPHAATKDTPGTFYTAAISPKSTAKALAEIRPLIEHARRSADLVFFTPHWGDNFKNEPSKATRAIAEGVIAMGVDGILGHSAHRVQGVEIIDGRPVIYDAGNVLNDYGAPARDAMSGVFVLDVGEHGVSGMRIYPYHLRSFQTVPWKGAALDERLQEIAGKCNGLGTDVVVEADHVRLEIPLQARTRPTAAMGAPRPKREVRAADPELWVDALPATATPASVRWKNGVELLGYEVLMDKLRIPKAGNVVTLYLANTQGGLSQDLSVQLMGTREGQGPDRHDHIPGDWMVTGPEWPKGKILRDRALLRHVGKAKGVVQLEVGLNDRRRAVPIESASLDRVGDRVILGRTPYVKGTPKLWDAWRAAEKAER